MFRPMRRKKKELPPEEAKQLLHTARQGVLAVNGDDGYPYAVPINFLYEEDGEKIYFHGAKAGHKLDAIRKCDKVCFTVFGKEEVKEEPWAPFVKSAVVFGRCTLPEYGPETLVILKRFAMKYYPEESLADAEICKDGRASQLFEIQIEHLSGKEIQEK